MENPFYYFGILYVKGPLEQTQYLYITDDYDEAVQYSTVVYPGSVIVQLQQAEDPNQGI
jgi:hypothetical protein